MFSTRTNRNLLTVCTLMRWYALIYDVQDYLLFLHGCFNSRWCREIMTDNAVYENKLQVRSARLLEQFCILKQLHHIWCILLEASRRHICLERFISWRQRILQTSSNTFMNPAVMAEQDGLTGSAWGDWANYTASPLRAFENELGVQAPVGFWDPAGLSQWWQRWELQAPSCHRNQAWPNFDACNHGIHHPRTYWKIPWLLVSICRFEVCRCSQWTCSNLQSASSRLGSDRGIHGLLRSFPRPVSWNRSLCWRLWMEAHHIGMTQRWRKQA